MVPGVFIGGVILLAVVIIIALYWSIALGGNGAVNTTNPPTVSTERVNTSLEGLVSRQMETSQIVENATEKPAIAGIAFATPIIKRTETVGVSCKNSRIECTKYVQQYGTVAAASFDSSRGTCKVILNDQGQGVNLYRVDLTENTAPLVYPLDQCIELTGQSSIQACRQRCRDFSREVNPSSFCWGYGIVSQNGEDGKCALAMASSNNFSSIDLRAPGAVAEYGNAPPEAFLDTGYQSDPNVVGQFEQASVIDDTKLRCVV